MNTDREENHGEYWPSPFAITFNVKKVWAWLVSLFLLAGVVNAQVAYCGVDVASSFVPNGGVAKQTLSNLALYSEDSSNAAYTKVRSTITANAITAPDGALTADKLVSDGTAANDHTLRQAFAGLTNPETYRISFYVKPAEITWIAFYAGFSSASAITSVNLSTGAIGTTSANMRSIKSYFVGNGWYRIEAIVTSNATSGTLFIYLGEADNDVTFDGDSTSGAYIWGVQVNLASAPADYLATTSSALTLGPLCPVGYTQSLTDPSRCFIVGPVTSRTIRTW